MARTTGVIPFVAVRKKTLFRIVLALVSVTVFFAIAEFAYRAIGGSITDRNLHQRYSLTYRDAERHEFRNMGEGIELGLLETIEGSPRPRTTFRPNTTFYLCYTGARQPYFDADGCVENRINSSGIREREELCLPKPEGQKRIVCIGDSFTFGWGVRVEDSWPRLVEGILRQDDDSIRTVNCGAAGTLYIDEYWWGLRDRFKAFEPDAVVLTICLNDVLPTSSALCHYNQSSPWYMRSHLLKDLLSGYAMADRLVVDPDSRLVESLLGLNEADFDLIAQAVRWWQEAGYGAFWSSGGPQRALLEARDWCRERGIRFGVVVWPYFQGLGPAEYYPFAKMHDLVVDFCGQNDIPALDLLPALDGQPTPELWVNPADMHGNDKAQRLCAPRIAEFVAEFADL